MATQFVCFFLLPRPNGTESKFHRMVRLRSLSRATFRKLSMCRILSTCNLAWPRLRSKKKKQPPLNSNDTKIKLDSPFNLGFESESVEANCLVHLRHTALHQFQPADDFFGEAVIRAVVSHSRFATFFEGIISKPTGLIKRLDSGFI